MSGIKKDWLVRIYDILDSIKEIEFSVSDHSQAKSLYDDRESFRAVERNIEIIAEASQHVPAEIKEAFSNIPWTKVINMRNVLAHEYSRVDYESVWNVVEMRIPELKKTCNDILEAHS